MTDLAAVVVNHDAGELLIDCVASLRAAGVSEIVVVDNASTDGSLERLADADRDVTLVPTGRNLGYGSAANRGVARCEAPYILICNPDLVVEKDAPGLLAAALDARDDLAACGPRLLNPDRTRYPSTRQFPSYGLAALHALVSLFAPSNRWSRRYRLEELDEIPENVDWISGSCMAVRRLAYESVGGFDEAYFMYVEDLDLCWRLRRAGWLVGYEDAAEVTHIQGVSAARRPVRMLIAHHRSTWRFAKRSATDRERPFLPVVAVGLTIRLVISVARVLIDGARASSSAAIGHSGP
jgi:N-acetylglucosaminyl-diphospho-decaprenol L-rhamnosyltransferase